MTYVEMLVRSVELDGGKGSTCWAWLAMFMPVGLEVRVNLGPTGVWIGHRRDVFARAEEEAALHGPCVWLSRMRVRARPVSVSDAHEMLRLGHGMVPTAFGDVWWDRWECDVRRALVLICKGAPAWSHVFAEYVKPPGVSLLGIFLLGLRQLQEG